MSVPENSKSSWILLVNDRPTIIRESIRNYCEKAWMWIKASGSMILLLTASLVFCNLLLCVIATSETDSSSPVPPLCPNQLISVALFVSYNLLWVGLIGCKILKRYVNDEMQHQRRISDLEIIYRSENAITNPC
jgi:hypothetical protein